MDEYISSFVHILSCSLMQLISPKLTEVIGVKRNFGVPSPAIITASYDGKPIVAFDHQHFMAIDFGSDSSCNLSSCTENDQSKLESSIQKRPSMVSSRIQILYGQLRIRMIP